MVLRNRLVDRIKKINSAGRVALCGYFLTGYRTPEEFYKMVRAAGKLDIIEYGIPSENPDLDGTIISNAHEIVTRQRGLSVETALALLGGLREIPQPRLVMTYTREARKMEGFLRKCLENDIQGVFAPDIEWEESQHIATIARTLNLAYTSFINIGMSREQILRNLELSDMVYLKIASGPTGHNAKLDEKSKAELQNMVTFMRERKPEVIIAGGIGIQNPGQIKMLLEFNFQMVIVGTRILQSMDNGEAEMKKYIEKLFQATHI